MIGKSAQAVRDPYDVPNPLVVYLGLPRAMVFSSTELPVLDGVLLHLRLLPTGTLFRRCLYNPVHATAVQNT